MDPKSKRALATSYSVARKAKKMYAGGETPEVENEQDEGAIGSRRIEDSYTMDDDSPLLHDEHEDFLTDYDSQDPFNERPEAQPSDSMHEVVNSEPPGNTDESSETDMLRELMKRRYGRR